MQHQKTLPLEDVRSYIRHYHWGCEELHKTLPLVDVFFFNHCRWLDWTCYDSLSGSSSRNNFALLHSWVCCLVVKYHAGTILCEVCTTNVQELLISARPTSKNHIMWSLHYQRPRTIWYLHYQRPKTFWYLHDQRPCTTLCEICITNVQKRPSVRSALPACINHLQWGQRARTTFCEFSVQEPLSVSSACKNHLLWDQLARTTFCEVCTTSNVQSPSSTSSNIIHLE